MESKRLHGICSFKVWNPNGCTVSAAPLPHSVFRSLGSPTPNPNSRSPKYKYQIPFAAPYPSICSPIPLTPTKRRHLQCLRPTLPYFSEPHHSTIQDNPIFWPSIHPTPPPYPLSKLHHPHPTSHPPNFPPASYPYITPPAPFTPTCTLHPRALIPSQYPHLHLLPPTTFRTAPFPSKLRHLDALPHTPPPESVLTHPNPKSPHALRTAQPHPFPPPHSSTPLCNHPLRPVVPTTALISPSPPPSLVPTWSSDRRIPHDYSLHPIPHRDPRHVL